MRNEQGRDITEDKESYKETLAEAQPSFQGTLINFQAHRMER